MAKKMSCSCVDPRLPELLSARHEGEAEDISYLRLVAAVVPPIREVVGFMDKMGIKEFIWEPHEDCAGLKLVYNDIMATSDTDHAYISKMRRNRITENIASIAVLPNGDRFRSVERFEAYVRESFTDYSKFETFIINVYGRGLAEEIKRFGYSVKINPILKSELPQKAKGDSVLVLCNEIGIDPKELKAIVRMQAGSKYTDPAFYTVQAPTKWSTPVIPLARDQLGIRNGEAVLRADIPKLRQELREESAGKRKVTS
ncbi:MAG TPA: hypothetical protein VL945_01625 [Candidatus Saccharimonadales bacterium]|nr:hypothetical protein [Candidatus Saccharimonadales bacterium]